MCTGVIEVALLVGAGLAAGATAKNAYDQSQDQRVAAHQTDLDAQDEKLAAEQRADLIRKSGKRTRAAVQGAYAAAGINVGEGSPVTVDNTIATDVEHDAWQEVLTGNATARRGHRQADAMRRVAGNTATQGYLTAGGTLLSGAASAYRSGWSSQPKPQQFPAPIYDRSIKVNG